MAVWLQSGWLKRQGNARPYNGPAVARAGKWQTGARIRPPALEPTLSQAWHRDRDRLRQRGAGVTVGTALGARSAGTGDRCVRALVLLKIRLSRFHDLPAADDAAEPFAFGGCSNDIAGLLEGPIWDADRKEREKVGGKRASRALGV